MHSVQARSQESDKQKEPSQNAENPQHTNLCEPTIYEIDQPERKEVPCIDRNKRFLV
jgi:hypothetical protein